MTITKRRLKIPTWTVADGEAHCTVEQTRSGLFVLPYRSTTYPTIEAAAVEGLAAYRRAIKRTVFV